VDLAITSLFRHVKNIDDGDDDDDDVADWIKLAYKSCAILYEIEPKMETESDSLVGVR